MLFVTQNVACNCELKLMLPYLLRAKPR